MKKGRYHGPVPLIELESGKELLQHQAEVIRSVYPNAEIISVVGVEAFRVYRKISGVIILENQEYRTTNVVRSIGIGLRQASCDNVTIINGDLFFDRQAITCIPTDRTAISVLRGRKSDVGVNVMNGTVVSWAYGLSNNWAKMTHICGEELKLFKKFVFDPAKAGFLTHEALSYVVNHGGIITPVPVRGLVVEMEDFL